MSSDWVKEWENYGFYGNGKKVTFSDYRKYIKARNEGFKILKGTRYEYQRNKYDEVIYSFRSRLDMLELVMKFEQ